MDAWLAHVPELGGDPDRVFLRPNGKMSILPNQVHNAMAIVKVDCVADNNVPEVRDATRDMQVPFTALPRCPVTAHVQPDFRC